MKIKKINKNLNIFLIIIIVLLVTMLLYIILNIYKKVEPFNEIILIEDTIYGKMKCFKGDKIICNSIITNKTWEPHILEILKQNYKENTNFLDIGSNYGCHTIGIANEIRKNKGSGKVYSFDLQPEIIKLFKENIIMNNLNDIVILNEVGLGDKNETKEFIVSKDYDNNDNPGSSSLYNSDNSDKNKKEIVTIKRLDDLNIDNISLIKIDVEGYELETFEGGLNTINKNKPIIVIEIWSHNLEKYTKWINEKLPFYVIEFISGSDYIMKPLY
jgi:FkbM family methyltransferase